MPWINGLDLGCAADFTALASIQQTPAPADWNGPAGRHYAVRWLERYDLGTPYPVMVEKVKATVGREPLKGSLLAVDFTGVGRPVVDILRAAKLHARLRPILITAGHEVTRDTKTGAYHVPKKELVSVLQVLSQQKRLRIAPGIKDAKGRDIGEALRKELANFKVKITSSANETFGAWRDGQHDDLVLAVALGCWLGENTGQGDCKQIGLPSAEKRSIWPEEVTNVLMG